jgi:uncharacterized protein YlxW (UPF0749 family)
MDDKQDEATEPDTVALPLQKTNDDAHAVVDIADVSDSHVADSHVSDSHVSDSHRLAVSDVGDSDVSDSHVLESATDSKAPVASETAAGPVGAAGFRAVWRRGTAGLRHPRMTGAGVVIALLVGLLGFALIAQVKSNSSSSTLANDRPDDLVRILSDLDARKDRLGSEISTLQEQQGQLSSGAQARDAALAAAAQRADELGILAGTLPAQGTGLTIALTPAGAPIAGSLVLDAVEALRGSGAEAMQISGSTGGPVRIVASTSFVDVSGGVRVDGQLLTGTLTITVIGDPQTMQTALTIPGEVDDMVKQAGGNVLVEQPGTVDVTALHPATPAKYAHPVS